MVEIRKYKYQLIGTIRIQSSTPSALQRVPFSPLHGVQGQTVPRTGRSARHRSVRHVPPAKELRTTKPSKDGVALGEGNKTDSKMMTYDPDYEAIGWAIADALGDVFFEPCTSYPARPLAIQDLAPSTENRGPAFQSLHVASSTPSKLPRGYRPDKRKAIVEAAETLLHLANSHHKRRQG